MNWFRHYHGLCADPKLTLVAEIAGVHHTVAVAAWCFVLEHVSSQDDRGSTEHLDAREMAISIRIETAEAQRVIDAIGECRLIIDGHVRRFKDRQFQSDSSTDRVRRFRAQKNSDEVGVSRNATRNATRNVSGNGMKRFRNVSANGYTETESETESDKTHTYRESESYISESYITPLARAILSCSDYRFDGKVIRLTEKDYERWRSSYQHIDLQAHLQQTDDWLASDASDAQRKKWFNLVSGVLRKRNDEAAAKARAGQSSDDWRLDPKQWHLPG